MVHKKDEQIELINKALEWAEKFRPDTFQFEEFKQKRRELKKIRFAISEKCSAAAYGESQVGKSYLMSSLLSSQNSQFQVSDGKGGLYSFIDELNPSGGNNAKEESTGVITRFTTNCSNERMKSFVRIRTLSVVDLVLMLTDSYYKDVKIENVLEKDVINEHVENIQSTMVDLSYSQKFITEDDLHDIQDYMKSVVGAIASNVSHSNFCSVIAPIIRHIKIDNWCNVFNLLWNRNEVITQKFQDIITEYSKLGFLNEVYVPFEAVLRKNGTILKVNWIDVFCGCGTPNDNTVTTTDVYDGNGIVAASNFQKSYLSVLTAELTFVIPQEVTNEKPFLKDMDLLDFPGARRRENVHERDIEKEMHNMLRRGKVAYLFNKYSRSLRINTVLFCQHADMSGQSEIGEYLNVWIRDNIGATPQERSNYINSTAKVSPLFIISTKFNIDLKWTNEKKGDALADRWRTRFDQTLSKEIIKPKTYSWFENWVDISAGFKSQRFQNIFMLRDFFWSRDQNIFKGFLENKSPELSEVKPEVYPDYREDLKRSFIDYPFVTRHFENPEKAWEDSATVTHDGSMAIIEKLNLIAPVINNARCSKYQTESTEIMGIIKRRLEDYDVPKNEEEKRKHTQRNIGKIRSALDNVFGSKPSLLGKVTDRLMIPSSVIRKEVYNVLVRHTDKPIDRAPINVIRMNSGILPNDDKETCLRKLMNQYKCDEQTLIDELSRGGLNLADVIAGEGELLTTMQAVLSKHIYDVWWTYVRNAFQEFESVFYSSDYLTSMYKILYEKVKMGDKLSEIIKEYIDKYPIEMLPTVVADATSLLLNNYINQVGQDLLDAKQKDVILENAKLLDIELDQKNTEQTYRRPSLEEALRAFDNSSDLISKSGLKPDEVDELRRLPWWDNFQRWRDNLVRGLLLTSDVTECNLEENSALKEILNQL